ncbi:MAG: DUF2207 domain-containing protein [Phycisphaerales bacterium]|nr:DUF2207 domain-containing protein [Phycisphaerales bacterium]
MPNPFNPLDWLKSAQDWFSKTERSSGFRPYLIFLILVFGIGICLIQFFDAIDYASETGLALIILSVVAFIILYYIKSLTDPDFCRSEQHVQKVMKLELETMGNEQHQIEGEVIEAEMLEQATSEPAALVAGSDAPPEKEGAE